MSIETVPDYDVQYHLLAFDANGSERPEPGGAYSATLHRSAVREHPTDVFVFSHGWFGDVPAARAQYGDWIATMMGCTSDLEEAEGASGGFRPLLVGLHWPSKAWGDEELAGASYTPSTTADTPVGPEAVVDLLTSRLTPTARTREAVHTIMDAALRDAAPRSLSEPVRRAYQIIDTEMGGTAGEGARPGEDREPLDPEQLYQSCLRADAVTFGGRSLGGVLAPLRVLTFWQMKRRACSFGETGAALLLADLQRLCPDARFHVMGHSFGCIVAAAAIAGPRNGAARRPVSSLVLVQGAMSLWSLCSEIPFPPGRPGYFHRLVTDALVDGPTLVTMSPHDRAVGTFYPLGAWSGRQVAYAREGRPKYGGIGIHGLRGPNVDVVDDVLGDTDACYELAPRRVHNLDASAVIAHDLGVSGAHSDICHPELAHVIWQAVASARRRPDCPTEASRG